MTDNEVTVIRQHRREVRRELVLLPFNPVKLLVRKVKRVVLEIQERRCVGRAVHRSSALQRHLAGEQVILHALHHDQHATFDLLLLSIRHVRPAVLVHVLLDGSLQGLKDLLVRTLYLVGVHCHDAIDLLGIHASSQQPTANSQKELFHLLIDTMFPVFSLNTITGNCSPVNKFFGNGTSIPSCATGIFFEPNTRLS